MTPSVSDFSTDVSVRCGRMARRGTAVTELALVAPIILLFMTLAYGLWRLTITEHDAFSAAETATAEKAVRFMSLTEIDAPPPFVPDSRTPEVAEVPMLSGVTEATLRAYASLPNSAAHAGGALYMEQMTDIGEDFGGFNLARDGMVLRPSWTFNGFPMVNTQHPAERDAVREWYYDAQEVTLTRDLRDRLGLSD
ncbi:MAG: hypothetical protein JNK58_08200 [Phycisphaerae bacterium]|nr:hypothetical protein [Phycisphaerae bacterium]